MNNFVDDNIVFTNKMPTEDFVYIINAMNTFIHFNNTTNSCSWDGCDKLINDKVFDKIGNGSNGYVMRYKNYAIKYYATGYPSRGSDGEMLEKLQGIEYFPKMFFYYKHTYMVTEFIEGVPMYRENMKAVDLTFADKYDEALKSAVSRGIEPGDVLHFCDNVRIRNNTPIFMDFGCFRFKYNECVWDAFIDSLRDEIKKQSGKSLETLYH